MSSLTRQQDTALAGGEPAPLRRLLRRAALWACELFVLPAAVASNVARLSTRRDTLFVTSAQWLSLIPGTGGCYLRRAFYRLTLTECADDMYTGFGTFVSHPTARIGRRVYIGSNCTIGTVALGDGVMIGDNVDILSGRHHHRRDTENRLLDAEESAFHGFRVGDHTWIGNRAVIMANIGKRCTVGAGSVVVKDVEDDQTVVGNPARAVARLDASAHTGVRT